MLKPAEIKKLISSDAASDFKRRAKVGQRYYEAEHDILKCRLFYFNADGTLVEDKFRSNSKISHPFFTELADQLAAYILSSDENHFTSSAEGLQERLDEYFDDEFWAEVSDLIVGAYSKGSEYIYGYQSAKRGRITFECADSSGTVEVREKDTDDGCKYIIYWYVDRIDKGRKTIKRILVFNDQEIGYFCQIGDGAVKVDDSQEFNPRKHIVYTKADGKKYGRSFGFIPFWRLDNNKKRQSGLKPIKDIIDDYDVMQCGLSNNLKDFDTPIHVVKGFEGDDLGELQTNLKTKKIVGVDEGGDVEVRTVDIPYQARKQKADDDEKNIYRFGMGVNTVALKDTSSTTNIAIKMAYTLLDLKAKKLEKRIRALLKELLQVVLDEINAKNNTDYQVKDVKITFEHEMIVNDKENAEIAQIEAGTKQATINTLLDLATYLDNETLMRAICEELEINYDEIKDKLPDPDEAVNGVKTAEKTLEDINGVGAVNSEAVKEAAEDEVGKALNGAQTQSLITIMQQFKNGVLSYQQAVNIISLAIGISEDRAKKLIGADLV